MALAAICGESFLCVGIISQIIKEYTTVDNFQ